MPVREQVVAIDRFGRIVSPGLPGRRASRGLAVAGFGLPQIPRFPHQARDHVAGQRRGEYAPAPEGKYVVDENAESPAGEFVRPGPSAVVAIPGRGDDRMRRATGCGVRYLVHAEVLVSPMVMQGEHARESAPGLFRSCEQGPGRRAPGRLPGEFLDPEPVGGMHPHDPDDRIGQSGNQGEGGEQRPRLRSPGTSIAPSLVKKGELRRTPGQERGDSRSIRTQRRRRGGEGFRFGRFHDLPPSAGSGRCGPDAAQGEG